MQLRLDAADRLVELVEERRGPVYAEEAARRLFALRHLPGGYARALLAEVVEEDARLAWSGDSVRLAKPLGHDLPLERAAFVVVDLETTGLRPGTCRICEIGAVRVHEFELGATFQTLTNPGERLAPAVARLTGLRDPELRRAPPPATAVSRFLAFAGDAVLVAHNARFDLAFLDRETERLTGKRIAAPVVDTVALARRVLRGRTERAGLSALAEFFGTATRPCHRALPDALATAEILIQLLGLAQERGAATVADLCELASTRTRRVYEKRSLAFGAPPRPGVYLFRDRYDQVLYVGRARDLRSRLRSYFRTDRQRPAVEAALAAVERIEWRLCGSELEAALEELRLLRELRPPANVRGTRPDRHVYLRTRGEQVVVSQKPGPLGPLRSRTRARLAARALRPAELCGSEPLTDGLGGAVSRVRARVRELSEAQRFEDAARARDRLAALEWVVAELRRLERLRSAECCLVVPAAEPGTARCFVVSNGRVNAIGTVASADEAAAALARAHAVEASEEPADVDELLLVGTFLRRPPPELTICPLDPGRIATAALRAATYAPPAAEKARSGSRPAPRTSSSAALF